MSAEEAHEAVFFELSSRSRDQLESRTMDLALEIEAGPPIGQKIGKLLAVRTANMDFDTAMQWSESAIPLVGMSWDGREGSTGIPRKARC